MRILRRAAAISILILPVALGADAIDATAKTPASPTVRAKTRSKPAKKQGTPTRKVASTAPRTSRGRATSGRKTKRPPAEPLSILTGTIHCPEDMVAVAGRVCVDRFEMSLVDRRTSTRWSPFYTPDPTRAASVAGVYSALRDEAAPESLGHTLALPSPPSSAIDPLATSERGVLPQGYVSANQAADACAAAGKRLCSESEWVTACRGEERTAFPYGDTYERGACNVVRENHPSVLLHGNAARFHDDPRNNLVEIDGKPLLRKTGETPRCVSRWGDDAIYDMVGNLDEWVSDPDGVFVGGFYARGTKSGCASRVSAHPRGYSDYSTGARCCADPAASPL